MVMKIAVLALIALAVVSGNEKVKRQSSPDFNEYFNKFQESMKPFVEGFPQMPNNFGSLPQFPGFGGSQGQGGSPSPSGGSYRYKRTIDPSMISEWFNQFQQGGNNGGNLPFKPPTFGNFPFGGSGTSESTQNEN